MCEVQLCVCVYALRQAAGCVKAGLGPAASQEDRRGSRWICLDLTLPTPLHPPGPPLPTCTPLHRVEGRWQNGSVYVWFGGWEVHVMLLVPSGESRKTDGKQREQERLCLCRPFLTDTVCAELCWHMAPASMLELLVCCVPLLSLFSSFLSLYTLHSTLSAKPALCLFVPRMSCLFWDIESPHPLRSTGCLLPVLATQPPTFLLWLSFSGRGFTCKHIIAVGSMVKTLLPQTDSHHYIQYTLITF